MPSTNELLDRHFEFIGARARVATSERPGGIALDVRNDRRGEYFEIGVPEPAGVQVVDRDRADRHLLLLVTREREKSRFLCGHDERHWFVAAIPEAASGVVNVARAKEALQPAAVREAARGLRLKNRLRRRNRAFRRQGEWFFVPAPDLDADPSVVLHREPLSRGTGSKPHTMEYAFRRGGTTVYVSRGHPQGLSRARYEALPEQVRQSQNWRQMVRDAEVFASGRVSHRDHATLVLSGWHRVLMNTENGARAMRHVAFLD